MKRQKDMQWRATEPNPLQTADKMSEDAKFALGY
jgi:hypothetical protein